jgi:hypothetical protein
MSDPAVKESRAIRQTLNPLDFPPMNFQQLNVIDVPSYTTRADYPTARRSYLDQGGTTPLLRAYAINCPRCSC